MSHWYVPYFSDSYRYLNYCIWQTKNTRSQYKHITPDSGHAYLKQTCAIVAQDAFVLIRSSIHGAFASWSWTTDACLLYDCHFFATNLKLCSCPVWVGWFDLCEATSLNRFVFPLQLTGNAISDTYHHNFLCEKSLCSKYAFTNYPEIRYGRSYR